MVFSSLLFVFRFLPIALLLYALTPRRFKNALLFVVSLVFYSWGEVKFFPLMMLCITVNYLSAILIERYPKHKRLTLILCLAVSLGMLVFFKYIGFLTGMLNGLVGAHLPILRFELPLGISFYTFQTIAYTIDVYRGRYPADYNYVRVGTFVSLFPQLIAGPIVGYGDVMNELRHRRHTLPLIEEGVRLFILGFGSKVLLANNIGMLWDQAAAIGYGNLSASMAWLSITGFAFQIYFDFSGYSLMGIGLGKILGFQFPQNFNMPYIARSVTDFWRRWHMTLSYWFRDNVYFPLGGSRRGDARTVLNLFIVWFLTGLWHGADYNFILWGLYFFALLVIEKFALRDVLQRHRALSHLYLIFLIWIGWVIFAVSDLGAMGLYFKAMFTGGFDALSLYYLRNYGAILLCCAVFSTPLFPLLLKKFDSRPVRLLYDAALVFIFLLCIAYLVESTYNPFLYFRF